MVSILAARNDVFAYRSNNCLFMYNIFEIGDERKASGVRKFKISCSFVRLLIARLSSLTPTGCEECKMFSSA